MEAEQRIVIGADSLWRRPAGNGLIEHAANPRPVDAFASNANPNESAGAHVDHHEDPMTKENRQVTHPEGRLPGMPRSTRLLADGASRYDLRIRTPHVRSADRAHLARNTCGKAFLAKSRPLFFLNSRWGQQLPVSAHAHLSLVAVVPAIP
jgi:hypothetical protein